MATTDSPKKTLRAAGALFVVSALAFAAAATVLSVTFDWPAAQTGAIRG